MRAAFLTPHYWGSRRRAGMHWLAESLARRGWDVLFMTVGMSWPLWIRRKDFRLEYPVREEANRLIEKEPGITSFVWITPWHPAGLPSPLLDRVATPLFRAYSRFPLGAAEAPLRQSDLLVFESSAALLLFDRLRALAPRARTVYRISDDLGLIGYHPVIAEAEAKTVDRFDLLSVPSRFMQRRHAARPHTRFHPQGIRKDLFDRPHPDPYGDDGGATRAVFVGNSHLDRDALRIAAERRPDWRFHVIGPLPDLPVARNIIAHGAMAFERTIPYLVHADVGLNIRSVEPGAESLAESLKVIQYTYCRLPIVAPDALRTVGDHVVYYVPGDAESLDQALHAAAAVDRDRIDRSWVRSWDDVAGELLEDVGVGGRPA